MATKQPAPSAPPKPAPGAPAKQTQATQKSVPSPKSLRIEWANGQDNWVRALVSEVITTRQELPDARIQHFYELMLKEKELLPGPATLTPPLSGRPDGAEAIESFTLAGLEATHNVNALVVRQSIDFNPRMTIVFCENASGKTGYVRVLKRAAAVRTAEVVLPNVNAPVSPANTPKAKIAYTIASQNTTVG